MAESSPPTARPNRLAHAASLYLRQHKDNPVDWFPWSSEALNKARSEDKPILLSIGYSACHWCHVMERESFENPRTAHRMNALFVNIKVDREERPDLDQIYQTALQVSGGHGGWPLTVFLTPALEPFFAGTYFPPARRHGMPAFLDVLEAVAEAYHGRREEVQASASSLTAAIAEVTGRIPGGYGEVETTFLKDAAGRLESRFDSDNGGFGHAPKFPNTMCLDVLLRASKRHEAPQWEQMAVHALEAMAAGGIHDHVGGGFHRYSTDAEWAIPHFEKMLYDNALLLSLYVDAWRMTKRESFARTAHDIAGYVLREMRTEDGAFAASQDADSDGEEGKFFAWTVSELNELLDPRAARAVALRYGVTEQGNFEGGLTVLRIVRPMDEVAAQCQCSAQQADTLIERSLKAMYERRKTRVAPTRDDKVIAAWNGLMIFALAEAAGALGEPRYLAAAQQALDFAMSHMWHKGKLHRICIDGQSSVAGFLDDYAALALGALGVYDQTSNNRALAFAERLLNAAIAFFWDKEEGGFFYAEPSSDLVVRSRDVYDQAVPSGTSAMCEACLRLYGYTREERWLEPPQLVLGSGGRSAVEAPLAFGFMLRALDRHVHGDDEVVILAQPDTLEAERMRHVVAQSYLANRLTLCLDPAVQNRLLGVRSELLSGRKGSEAPVAFVCSGRACSAPVRSADALAQLLARAHTKV